MAHSASEVGSSDSCERDETYYFSVVTFKVENCIFRIPIVYLQVSDVFTGMFSLPNELKDGASDANPIVLEGITKDEFRQLLRVLIPSPAGGEPSLTIAEWTAVLKLATMWMFSRIRALAVERLDAQVRDDPIERIVLGDRFGVGDWELEGLAQLCRWRDDLTEAQAERIGLRRTLKVMNARMGYLRRFVDTCGCKNRRWQMHCAGCDRWGPLLSVSCKPEEYNFRGDLEKL